MQTKMMVRTAAGEPSGATNASKHGANVEMACDEQWSPTATHQNLQAAKVCTSSFNLVSSFKSGVYHFQLAGYRGSQCFESLRTCSCRQTDGFLMADML